MTTTRNTFTASDREITISRVVSAPRELVWEAMTNPKHVANWWGPRGFSTTIETMDFRVGGQWKHVMRGPDGANYPNKSTFKEITKPERIVFSHGGGREEGPGATFVATWTFDIVEPGKTKVTINMVFPTPDARDFVVKEFGAIEGGKQTLTRLDEYLDSMRASDRQVIISRIVDAPRELVWEAITSPQHVVNWWGPRGFSTTIETMDVRIGGELKMTMVGPDGARYPNRYVFTELAQPGRIVMSHSGRREGGPEVTTIKTWTFDTMEDGRTRVTFRLEFSSAAERDSLVKDFGVIEGTHQTLARLDEFLPQLNNQTIKQNTNQTSTTMKSFINPYLNFDGRCDEALEFYKKAIGIKVGMLMRFKDVPDKSNMTPGSEEKVCHADFTFGDSIVMASDGHCTGKGGFQGVNLSLNLPDVATAEKCFNALSQGGQVEMPLGKTFFSPAFGMLKDRFGLMWMVHVPGPQHK